MQVSPIIAVNTVSGINSVSSSSNINNITFNHNDKDVFKPSFTAYENALVSALKSDIKKESMFVKAFDQIFDKIVKSDNITKNADFAVLADVYNKNGFWGLMKSLWSAETSEKALASVIEKAANAEGTLILAKHNDKPVMELHNWGRYGWKSWFSEQKDAPRNTKLIFKSTLSNDSLECSLGSKGELKVWKKCDDTELDTIYNIVSGNKKKDVLTENSFPETVYYNSDGSVNNIKTHLLGGLAIPIW